MNIEALPWKDIITIALASVGAALGIMNTWNALSQRRVRLVVRPTYALDPNGSRPPMLSISVTNLSSFPMTINEVGFTGPKGAKRGKRAMITRPHVIDGKPWPRRLGSREAVSLYFGLEDVHLRHECGSNSLLKKASPELTVDDSITYHESLGGSHAGRFCGSGRVVFVHLAGGPGACEPSAEKDSGTRS